MASGSEGHGFESTELYACKIFYTYILTWVSCFPLDFHVPSSSVLASHPSHLRSCVPDILGTQERKFFTGTQEQETQKSWNANFAFLNFINKCDNISCI